MLEEGEQQIVCNEKIYEMRSGDIAFFDSYDIHGYLATKKPCKSSCVLIIPYYLLEHFQLFRRKMRIKSPILSNPILVKKILKIIDELLSKTEDKNVAVAAVDMILAFLEAELKYTTDKGEDTLLVTKILVFIEKNFRGDTKLSAIARYLGYTEEHLSREFHKYLHQSIPYYVNRLRLEYVECERAKSEKPVSQIIYEAGFRNFQTYYRYKKNKEEGEISLL